MFRQITFPNPQHPPAHRVVASPLYAARPPQGTARHVAAMPLYVVHHAVAGFVALDFPSPVFSNHGWTQMDTDFHCAKLSM
jgi:hypothetical protein